MQKRCLAILGTILKTRSQHTHTTLAPLGGFTSVWFNVDLSPLSVKSYVEGRKILFWTVIWKHPIVYIFTSHHSGNDSASITKHTKRCIMCNQVSPIFIFTQISKEVLFPKPDGKPPLKTNQININTINTINTIIFILIYNKKTHIHTYTLHYR